jgi:type II secretory pathway pseudopilin PulG
MNSKSKRKQLRRALNLVEMVIALAMMCIIFATIMPQLKAINDSWASKQANTEVNQNGRVLIDQINRSLSSADRINNDVSEPCNASGYIEFEDNAGTTFRCDIAANNYIEFGTDVDSADIEQIDSNNYLCVSTDSSGNGWAIIINVDAVATEISSDILS